MRSIKLNILFVLALFVYFVQPNTTQALTVTPIRSEIVGNPGETVEVPITLINEQKESKTFYTSFANFESQGETGNPAFTDNKLDLASWMSAQGAVTLSANENRIIKIKIAVPTNAEPGGHFAAVFFGTIAPDVEGTKNQVTVGGKIGSLILLSVPGDVKEGGGLLEYSTKDNKKFYNALPVSFVYRFKNDGGDRIKPIGKIAMHNLFYIPESKIDANPSTGNILPGSTRRFEVDWIKNPRAEDYVKPTGKVAQFFDQAGYQWRNFAMGPYFAKISLLYGTSATRVSDTVFFFVFPWQLMICLIIILFIVFWGGKKLLKRYNRYIIQKARAGMSMPNDAKNV